MLGQLRDRLFERIDETPGRAILAMLDLNHPVAPSHPLHIDRLAQRPIKPELCVVPRDDRMTDPGSHPRLLVLRRPGDLGYQDEALLALTLDCALQRRTSINGAYVCGWLVVHASPEQIAAQIRNRIVVNDMSTYQRKVVPLFEPHRLVLASCLAPARWFGHWLGDIDSWFLIDASGQLREIRATPCEDAQPLFSPPGRDFWQAQSRVRQAREVLLAMVKAGQPIAVDSERKIDHALQEAYRVGLSKTEDVIFFAMNHMVLPRQWHTHPTIRACIARAVSENAALADSMSALPDDVLGALSQSALDEARQQITDVRT